MLPSPRRPIQDPPSTTTPSELLNDRALLGRTALSPLTFLHIRLQRSSELFQLYEARVEFLDFSHQQPLYLAAPPAATAIAEPEQFADFGEREPVRLRLFDEADPVRDAGGIHPKSSGGASGTRHETQALVVAKGVRREATLGRQLANTQCLSLGHQIPLRRQDVRTQRRLDALHRGGHVAQTTGAPRISYFARTAAGRNMPP